MGINTTMFTIDRHLNLFIIIVVYPASIDDSISTSTILGLGCTFQTA